MNPLNCHQINELLSAYLENELDATTTLTVANHLDRCPLCERELAFLTNISNLVKSAVEQIDKKDESLISRANTINAGVKAQIAINPQTYAKAQASVSSLSSYTQSESPSTNNVVTLNTRREWLRGGKKLLLSLAASLAIVFLSLFALTQYSTSTGPLMSGAARNHQFCSAIELSSIGWHKGHSTEKLLEVNNIKLPQFNKLGIEFSDLHPCEVYNMPFLHLMYKKEDKSISIYYGSENTVAKLKETIPDIVPNKLYLQQESDLQIGAISTLTNNLWLVAGQLTEQEINAITSQLPMNSSSQTEQSQLFH
ncbi:MAG: hypothetical protein FD167_1655 [bacterium]|nr:MAG: hypothetical protein FD167_1655 [bacterium]